MERRAVGLIEPVARVKRQQLHFGPLGQIRRFIEYESPGVDTRLDRHTDERSIWRAAQQAAAPGGGRAPNG